MAAKAATAQAEKLVAASRACSGVQHPKALLPRAAVASPRGGGVKGSPGGGSREEGGSSSAAVQSRLPRPGQTPRGVGRRVEDRGNLIDFEKPARALGGEGMRERAGGETAGVHGDQPWATFEECPASGQTPAAAVSATAAPAAATAAATHFVKASVRSAAIKLSTPPPPPTTLPASTQGAPQITSGGTGADTAKLVARTRSQLSAPAPLPSAPAPMVSAMAPMPTHARALQAGESVGGGCGGVWGGGVGGGCHRQGDDIAAARVLGA